MNPLLIGAICGAGAGFIAFWCSFSRTFWPLMILSVLLAVIALQLRGALVGDGVHHDLSAWIAMQATVIPALGGVTVGLVAGQALGQGLVWKSWQGALATALLTVAAGAVVLAGLV